MNKRQQVQEVLIDALFEGDEIIQEIKNIPKEMVNKIQDKLKSALKNKDPNKVEKALKVVPEKSLDEIKTMMKKKVFKKASDFEQKYKKAQDKIKNVKNEQAKRALALMATSVSEALNKDVEEVIDENQRVFDPKNVLMLLLGLLFLAKFAMMQAQGFVFVNPVTGYLFLGIAALMVIKTTYNLIAGKEAKHLFIIL